MPHKWPMVWKTKVGFAFALVGLGVTGITSYLSVVRLREDDAWTSNIEEAISSSRSLLSHITDAETAQRGYAITGEETYLEPYRAAQQTIQADFKSLRGLTAGNVPEQRQLDALAALVGQRMARLGEEVELRRRQGFVAARVATETDVGKQLQDQIRLLTSEMETAEQGILRQRQTVARRGSERTTAIIVAGSIVPLAIVAGALFTVRKRSRQAVAAAQRQLAELRESETRFRELAENIAEVFWIADPRETRKLYISPAYEKIWGRTCRSAYASPHLWLDSIRPEDRDRVREALGSKQTQGAYDVEYRIVRPDGTERSIRDRAFPVREAGGAIRRWVGVAEDITEYSALKEHLQQTQKMEAMGTLAAGIAHDFNNILASINGFTELARLELKGSPEAREYLSAVLQSSGRAADLVSQILTFCRQEQVDRRPIQLGPVVLECLKLLRATLPSTISFDTLLATDAPVVLADATQVHQIMMNLGTNAWHAMEDRTGRLQVRLEKWVVDVAQAATEPRLHPGVYARISVSDTGSGMDQATLRRIFDPFFTTKPAGAGTGLGLAVVHGIMDSHDGAITVGSQPGKGTVFCVYFPAHDGGAVAAVEETGAVPRGNGERVLVVDDEEVLARLGQKSLAALGYDAELVTEPAAALAMVRADPGRFALVLTDQTMPGMTGLELAGRLREVLPGLPVILTTGFAPSLTPDRIEAAGVQQLLLKPTTLHSLGTAVHAALAGA